MDYQYIALNDLLKDDDMNQGESRIRIYGNILGTTQDIISLWESIEKNYINIIAYNKIITEILGNNETMNLGRHSYLSVRKRPYGFNNRIIFMEYCENYNIADIISPDEYPVITKINFNSPGFWEVIGQWNPFEQLRNYIQERHLRIKDKKYVWDMEKKNKQIELESKQLSNDLLKLDIVQKMILQLKEIGLSDIEIRHVVQKVYSNLDLINSHIDDGRIIKIKKVDVQDDEI